MQSREALIKKKLTDFANMYKAVATLLAIVIENNNFKAAYNQYKNIKQIKKRFFDYIKSSCDRRIYKKCVNYEIDDIPDYLSPILTIDTYNKILSLKYANMKLNIPEEQFLANKISIELNYKAEIAYVNIVEILYKNGYYPEAIEYCKYLLKLSDIAPLWELMAKSYRKLGMYGDAIEAYDRYLLQNNGDNGVKQALRELYEETLG